MPLSPGVFLQSTVVRRSWQRDFDPRNGRPPEKYGLFAVNDLDFTDAKDTRFQVPLDVAKCPAYRRLLANNFPAVKADHDNLYHVTISF